MGILNRLIPQFDSIKPEEFKEEFKQTEPEVDLLRVILKSIVLDFLKTGGIEEDLTEKEKKELYANAELIRTNPAFEKVAEYLINAQGNYTVKEALNMEQVSFGRATINGISLVKEEIERLSNIYRAENQSEEKFDKSSIMAE